MIRMLYNVYLKAHGALCQGQFHWQAKFGKSISEHAMKQSAGTLLYREGPGGLEVLIVHASGSYNRKAPWSIPKGVPDAGEELADAARRETMEETGARAGELTALGSITYTKSRKQIHAFAGPAPPDAEPRCASWEVDQARFVPLDEARGLLHPEQAVFIDRLRELLGKNG
jgi:predicted NUDIX family NTP pyrophosphohydrolase